VARDAVGVSLGVSLGMGHAHLGFALGFIAIQAFALAFVGLALGRRLGAKQETGHSLR
jgi:hypothetical protein